MIFAKARISAKSSGKSITYLFPKRKLSPFGIANALSLIVEIENGERNMRELKFTYSEPGCDRVHHVTEKDIRVVLARLPEEVKHRLSGVHFNDQSKGGRILGYVNPGHREIALCALPPRMSLTRFLVRGQSCAEFGAVRGTQWPELAVRRFLLYDVFLHELGHLQVINERPRSERLRFAREKFAEEFADYWRRRLWLTDFDHADPAHNAPPEFNLNTRPVLQTIQRSVFKM